MACAQMAVGDFLKLWFLLGADLLRHKAPGMENTAGGRIGRAWQISLQDNFLPLAVALGNRDGRQKRLGVGMGGIVKQFLFVRHLHHMAQIHHHHPVGDVFDDA